MIRTLITVIAGLLGLAFGSFLNVCVSRWPEGESVVTPRSHCRNCESKLAWWENIPVLSWVVLRGHCRTCRAQISVRYPLVELAVAVLWAYTAWQATEMPVNSATAEFYALGRFVFYWLLVALAALDAENLWLPNALTFPGIALGLIFSLVAAIVSDPSVTAGLGSLRSLGDRIIAVLVTAGFLLLIRWLYGVIRHREGMGLGDVKLIAMLAAWLGLPGTLLAFFISAMLGAIAAIAVIVAPSRRESGQDWATAKLPFGTFLCIGGIISSLWGQPIISAYLHMVGF